MADGFFRLPGGLGVVLQGVPLGLLERFRAQLGLFWVDSVVPSLRIAPLGDDRFRAWPGLGDRLGIAVGRWRDRPALAVGLAGRVDCVLVPGEPWEIRFAACAKALRRVWGLALFALRRRLAEQGRVLAHGAVVGRDGRWLMVAGHRGLGKTRLLLTLLEQGWDFLADDKCILAPGGATAFQDFIVLRAGHTGSRSWPVSLAARQARLRRRAALARPLRAVARAVVPARCLPSPDRFLNPSQRLPVTALFPDRHFQPQAVLAGVVVLEAGAAFKFMSLEADEGLRISAALQRLAYHDYGALEELVELTGAIPVSSLEERLSPALARVDFFRATLPPQGPPPELIKELAKCLPLP